LILLVGGGFFLVSRRPGTSAVPTPTPTPLMAEQLPPDQQPQVNLTFTSDGHYVTINITDIHAAQLEYNIIYDATVKKNRINTGVTGGARLDGKSDYSYKQLLGSESSGKYTYHENITNAVMELTLRNENNYSVFSATYPFDFSPGKTIDLTPAE
jgi:hypothetical protein